MERYNPSAIYWLGFHCALLRDLDGQKLLDVYNEPGLGGRLNRCSVTLDGFLQFGSKHGFSAGTKKAASEIQRLLEQASQYMDRASVEDAGRHAKAIESAMRTFQDRYIGDCVSLNLFTIPQPQTHDVTALLEQGERLVAPMDDWLQKYPKALADTKEAGRCLAFKLWTATGFHIARATENLIQEYYKHVMPGHALPTKAGQRTWVKLTENMLGGPKDKVTGDRPKPHHGNKRLLETLDMIGRNYRNPLIHPEHSLEEQDGAILVSLCTSVMGQMLTLMTKARV